MVLSNPSNNSVSHFRDFNSLSLFEATNILGYRYTEANYSSTETLPLKMDNYFWIPLHHYVAGGISQHLAEDYANRLSMVHKEVQINSTLIVFIASSTFTLIQIYPGSIQFHFLADLKGASIQNQDVQVQQPKFNSILVLNWAHIAVMLLRPRNAIPDAEGFHDEAVMRWVTQFAAVDYCGNNAAF
ncbi:hypothetical protein E3N88_21734 [Mikania micrantha]|uniref:Uncharacterized protein n=1 Tax=Mikania micrantha TaxID=192012 RepID=A0A5N6N9X4_9ASTR|nr:hypothetical protein E3N88_21734 [Mikania micrantha]